MKTFHFSLLLCAFLLWATACKKTTNQARNTSNNATTMAVAGISEPSSENETQNAAEEMQNPPQEKKQKSKLNFAQLSLNEIYASQQTQNQLFAINPEQTKTLTLAQGTKISIPENAFVIAGTNELATGEVKIEAKEVRNIAECLKMGVTTMSDKGLLESGGMLYISATAQGKRCELQKGKTLAIEMPSWGEMKEDMALFSGEKNAEGKVEWKEMANGKRTRIESGSIAIEGDQIVIDLSFPYVWNRCQELKEAYELVKKLNNKADLWKYQDSVLKRGMFTSSSGAIPSGMSICEYMENYEQRHQLEIENAKKDALINKVSKSANKYVFSSSSLGWINCDRFTNEPKTNVSLSAGDYDELHVSVIYKKIRSLMAYSIQSSDCKIMNIPQNQEVSLFVIKRMNQKLYYALKETNTNIALQNGFDFQELTEDKLAFLLDKFAKI